MDQWYFDDSGEQRGPVAGDEIRSLLATGKLKTGTLVWSEGMTEWKPAGLISRFQTSPYAPPSVVDSTEVDWSDHEPSGSQIRPWVRYWARTLDYLTFCFLIGGGLMIVWPAMEKINDTLLGALMLLLYNFVEPIMLTLWGTTPFKALLRIRVRNLDGSKPSYFRGISRCFSVWIRGHGLGIPLVALVTSIMSYNRLSNHGITSWDQEGGFTVSHQTIQWWRWLILIGLFVGFVALMAFGAKL